jgi:hypothetical protein
LGILALIIVSAGWGMNYFSGAIGLRVLYLYLALFILLYLVAVVRRDLSRRLTLVVVKFLFGRRSEAQ